MKRFSFVLGALAIAGCGASVTDDNQAGGAGGTTDIATTSHASTSASVTTTASTTVVSSSSAGGCAQDCSTLPVPACNESVCNDATHACEVKAVADGTDCDDGLFCTDHDTCESGVCQPGQPRICPPMGNDPCLMMTCDEGADMCTGTPSPNGTPCTSTDLCTENTICQAGHCLGSPKDCSALPVPDDCHVSGACDPTNGNCLLEEAPDGTACVSGDTCETNKTCTAGVCGGGTPIAGCAPVCPSGQTLVTVNGAGAFPIAIPDNNPTGITSSATVTQTGVVQAAWALFDITHTYDDDLLIKLTPPAAGAVTLVDNVGGSADNFTNTLISSLGLVVIGSAGTSAPFTGFYLPTGSFAPVIGTAAPGDWVLGVTDQAGIDTGTLNSWTLYLCVQ